MQLWPRFPSENRYYNPTPTRLLCAVGGISGRLCRELAMRGEEFCALHGLEGAIEVMQNAADYPEGEIDEAKRMIQKIGGM